MNTLFCMQSNNTKTKGFEFRHSYYTIIYYFILFSGILHTNGKDSSPLSTINKTYKLQYAYFARNLQANEKVASYGLVITVSIDWRILSNEKLVII